MYMQWALLMLATLLLGAGLYWLVQRYVSRPLRALKPHEIASRLRLLTPPTAIRVLSELRDLKQEAIANGEAENSPAMSIKPPKHRGLRERMKFESWQSMRELSVAHPQRWVKALLLLAILTGQRRGDLAKMRFDDIHDGHLHVEHRGRAGLRGGVGDREGVVAGEA